MKEFSGQAVLVTGAAGNLGRAAAKAFHAQGARIALADRSPDRLEKLFPEYVEDGRVLFVTSIDLIDEDSVAGMVEKTATEFGGLHSLIHTAGGYQAGDTIEESTLETWEFMQNLNARTTFLTNRAVIPWIRKGESGNIVNIGAYNARSGKPRMAPYVVSKSAVMRLTESLAEELRPDNINVNCLLPNVIDTPANRAAMPDADHTRWVKPEAIADVMVFLCSRAGRSIYGACIPVRGPC